MSFEYKTSGRWFNLVVRKLGLSQRFCGCFEVGYERKSENSAGAAMLDVCLKPDATPEQFYTLHAACKACGFIRAEGTARPRYGQTVKHVTSLKDKQGFIVEPKNDLDYPVFAPIRL